MKLYNITKGQLISLWIFGILMFFFSLDGLNSYSPNVINYVGVFLVPAVLVFYTIGWRNLKKGNKIDKTNAEAPSVLAKTKHVVVIFLKSNKKNIFVTIITVLVIGVIGAISSNNSQGNYYENQQSEEYIGLVGRYDKNVENAKKCLEDQVSKLKEINISACQQKYDNAYISYKNCRQTISLASHFECLKWTGTGGGTSDYESIDCSEDKIVSDIKKISQTSCYLNIQIDYDEIISFEERQVTKFIDSFPSSKTVFTQEELQDLYNLIPQEAIGDKTIERLNKNIEEQGYTITP